MEILPRAFVIAGLVMVGVGIVLSLHPTIPLLGKLPGDITIDRPGLRVYLPFASCIVLSVLLSGALWLFAKLR